MWKKGSSNAKNIGVCGCRTGEEIGVLGRWISALVDEQLGGNGSIVRSMNASRNDEVEKQEALTPVRMLLLVALVKKR